MGGSKGGTQSGGGRGPVAEGGVGQKGGERKLQKGACVL